MKPTLQMITFSIKLSVLSAEWLRICHYMQYIYSKIFLHSLPFICMFAKNNKNKKNICKLVPMLSSLFNLVFHIVSSLAFFFLSMKAFIYLSTLLHCVIWSQAYISSMQAMWCHFSKWWRFFSRGGNATSFWLPSTPPVELHC